MTRHVEAVGIVSWVMGGLCLLGTVFFAAIGVLGGLGILEPQDGAGDRAAGVLGSAMFALPLAALGVGHIVAGTAIRRRRGRSSALDPRA